VQRKQLVAIVVAGVTLSTATGWVAAGRIKSPAQAAAEKDPPAPSAITAPVERRELASTVTGRGNVRYGDPTTITLAASTYDGGRSSSLVTKPADKGAVLGENAVAMEVNGRPVRTLVGNVPMYRDIRPGDKGEDVRQLEAALERLGYHPGKVDGVYDIATQGAVEAWYRAAGYSALGATEDEKTKLHNAHSAVSQAESALLQAEDTLDKVRKGITDKDVHQAESEVRQRARDIDKANDEVQSTAASETAARANERAAHAAEDAARAAESKTVVDNRLTIARAKAEVAAAGHRVTEAQAAKKAADQRLYDDENTYAGDPPHRVASDAQIESDRAEVTRAANAIVEAGDNLDNANLAEDAAQAAADQATRMAALETLRAAASSRQAELGTLQAVQASMAALRAVDAAHDAATVALDNLALVKEPPDEKTAVAQLEKAKADLADARAQERDLSGEIGIVVPANEVLFFPTLPLRVDDPKVERGDDATKEVMVVTTSRLAIDANVSVADAKLVHVGDKVNVRETQLGVEATGTVSEVASAPGTDGAGAQQVHIEIVPDELPDQLTGASVAISIAVKTTNGKVLAVPVAAVTVDGSGNSRVKVVESDGTRRTVPVTTGLSAEGYVEIKPKSGRLDAGDRVLVGSTRG
jgi:peptidoglycan hydrolase-like protein with peptidoglycan-binding domain